MAALGLIMHLIIIIVIIIIKALFILEISISITQRWSAACGLIGSAESESTFPTIATLLPNKKMLDENVLFSGIA